MQITNCYRPMRFDDGARRRELSAPLAVHGTSASRHPREGDPILGGKAAGHAAYRDKITGGSTVATAPANERADPEPAGADLDGGVVQRRLRAGY